MTSQHSTTPSSTALHTTTVGSGEIPLVFLHGLFGQGKNFTSIAKSVADIATCTLVDLPNHGRSGWSERVLYPEMSRAVVELLEGFAEPVALVGHSMGGKVAMRVALEAPQLVERLMVVDISPAVGLGTNFSPMIAAMRSLDLAHLGSRTQADEQLRAAIPDDVVRGFLMQNLRHDAAEGGERHWRWQVNLEAIARDLDTGIADWPAIDASYPGPVLWVAGEHSSYVRPEASPTMRALFPRHLQVTIKGAGHWVHSEQPERFSATLRHFLTAR